MHRFKLFATSAADNLELGADALLYVMAYDHTISVPDEALRHAEKVGVISIARRDTPEPVLRRVNRALDVIALSLHTRADLDRRPPVSVPEPVPADPAIGGQLVPVEPAPIVRPPSGQKVEIRF